MTTTKFQFTTWKNKINPNSKTVVIDANSKQQALAIMNRRFMAQEFDGYRLVEQ